ncbi:flagellar biosynthesis protein FliQ [Frateuria aurantia]
MTPESVVALGQHALFLGLLICSPVLLAILLVGLLVGMFQAATQINETTLSFIPKIVVVGLVMLFTGPWMLRTMVDFTHQLLSSLPDLVR